MLSSSPADLVLLDYDLSDERGSSLVAELKSCQHDVKVLMVTAGMTDSAMLQTIEAGASGVFSKQSNPDRLLEAIRWVARNGIWLDAEAVQSLISARTARAEQVEQHRIGNGKTGSCPQTSGTRLSTERKVACMFRCCVAGLPEFDAEFLVDCHSQTPPAANAAFSGLNGDIPEDRQLIEAFFVQ